MTYGSAKTMAPSIVFACDSSYAMPLATCLRSIVESSRCGGPLDIHVLCSGISQPLRDKVLGSLPAGSVSIKWVDLNMVAFGSFQTQQHVSKMTFARLLLPRVLPDLSRVLYLDADILVLDDLRALWGTDLGNAIVGAVLNDPINAELKASDPVWKAVPRVRDYFNAGVLLVDLDGWRREQVSERALAYLFQHPHSPLADQDALNVVFDGRWKKLDGRWNCQAHLHFYALRSMRPEQKPGIIHFVTAGKPWNAWVPNANAAEYDRVRGGTLFARTRRERARDWVLAAGCLVKEACKRRQAGRVFYRVVRRAWRGYRTLRAGVQPGPAPSRRS